MSNIGDGVQYSGPLLAYELSSHTRRALSLELCGAARKTIAQPVFGIRLSTTWSIVKLAAFARGGNSLKLETY